MPFVLFQQTNQSSCFVVVIVIIVLVVMGCVVVVVDYVVVPVAIIVGPRNLNSKYAKSRSVIAKILFLLLLILFSNVGPAD